MGKNLSLSGSLPNSESANGWLGQVDDLLKEPGRKRVAIVEYDVDSIKHKVSTDVDMATVRLRTIEPITDEKRVKTVLQVMGDIREQRTGERELQLEFADEDAPAEGGA